MRVAEPSEIGSGDSVAQFLEQVAEFGSFAALEMAQRLTAAGEAAQGEPGRRPAR